MFRKKRCFFSLHDVTVKELLLIYEKGNNFTRKSSVAQLTYKKLLQNLLRNDMHFMVQCNYVTVNYMAVATNNIGTQHKIF